MEANILRKADDMRETGRSMLRGLLVQHCRFFMGQRRRGVADHHALPEIS